MRKLLLILGFIFICSSSVFAVEYKWNPFTGKQDITNSKAEEIKVTDVDGYFGYTASPATVESALKEVGASRAVVVSNTAYGASWDGVTLYAPSKNAVYDKIETITNVTLDANADTLLSLSTQELGLDTQTANKIFSGPGSGANAIPTFRTLIDSDIPDNVSITEADTFYSVVSRGSVAGASISASNVTVATGSGTFGQLKVTGNADIDGDLYVADAFITGIAGESYVLGNFGIGNSAPGFLLRIGTSPGQGLFVVNANGSVGIGTTGSTDKLKVVGRIVADTISTTTLNATGVSNLNNIATGTWSGDVLAIGKIPTIPLTTQVSETLPLDNTPIIPLATKTSGTLPDASAPVNITNNSITSNTGSFTQLTIAGTNVATTLKSGTGSFTDLILAGTFASTTLKSGTGNFTDLLLAGTFASITLKSGSGNFTDLIIAGTNSAVTLKSGTGSFTDLILANTFASVTLKSGTGNFTDIIMAGTNIGVNLKSGTGTFTDLIIAGTKSSTQLTTNTLRSGDTVPLMRLNVLNTAVGTLPGATLHINKAYLVDTMYAQIIGAGATNIIFTLREVNSSGTGSLYNLSAGQTATTGLLTVTSFTGGSVPAGNLLVVDILAVNGGGTAPSLRLEIFGHEQ